MGSQPFESDPSHEADWVSVAQRGDCSAYDKLVDRYWDRLRRWLFGLTFSEHVAEDLAQEAFVKAWTSLDRLRDASRFRAWLFRIARNLFRDHIRRGPPEQVGLPAGDVAESRNAPPEVLLEHEARQRLEQAIAELGTRYREAYLLWNHEKISYEEIAKILSISEATARWRVCKARQTLLERMSDYLNRPDKP